MKICVLQNGWVMIGNLEKNESNYSLKNGYIIRRWGTTEGLGELAIKGRLENTLLDKIPLTNFHESQLIFTIQCDESKWDI